MEKELAGVESQHTTDNMTHSDNPTCPNKNNKQTKPLKNTQLELVEGWNTAHTTQATQSV